MQWIRGELAHARQLLHQLNSLETKTPPELADQLAQSLDRLEAGLREMSSRLDEGVAFANELESLQEKLQQSHALYEDLFTRAPVGYLVMDPDGRIRQANHLANQLIGRTAAGPGNPLPAESPGLGPQLANLAAAAATGRPALRRLRTGKGDRLLAYAAAVSGADGQRLVRAVLLEAEVRPAWEEALDPRISRQAPSRRVYAPQKGKPACA